MASVTTAVAVKAMLANTSLRMFSLLRGLRTHRRFFKPISSQATLWISLYLEASELHHLLPFLGFGLDLLAESLRRLDQRLAAQFDQALLHLGFGQDRVDLGIELCDDLLRRVLRRADPEQRAR